MNQRYFVFLLSLVFIFASFLYAHATLREWHPKSLNELCDLVKTLSYTNSQGTEVFVSSELSQILGMHPSIVIISVEEFNRLYPTKKIAIENLQWLVLGSILEDVNVDWPNLISFKKFEGYFDLGRLPNFIITDELINYQFPNDNVDQARFAARCLNHFLVGGYASDPYGKQGRLTDKAFLLEKIDKVMDYFRTDYFADGYGVDDNGNIKYINNMGYKLLKSSSVANKYIRLGHILHLLADMTCPSHTRNDDHSIQILDESHFETFFSKNIDYRTLKKDYYQHSWVIAIADTADGNIGLTLKKTASPLSKEEIAGTYTLKQLFQDCAQETASRWFSEDTCFLVRWWGRDLLDPVKLVPDFKVFLLHNGNQKEYFIVSGYDQGTRTCKYALAAINQGSVEAWYKYNTKTRDRTPERSSICELLEQELKNATEDDSKKIYIKHIDDRPGDKDDQDHNEMKGYCLNDDFWDTDLSGECSVNNDLVLKTWGSWSLRTSVKYTTRFLYMFSNEIGK